MFNVVLFEPEIPPNTGNIIRLCANTGCQLHLIEPLGFEMDNKRLRRAGLDYAEWATIQLHNSWRDYTAAFPESPVYAATTKATRPYSEIQFRPGDSLLLGPETRGLPSHILQEIGHRHCLRIPMVNNNRSLNLSNSAAILVYEAWRQQDYAGA